MKNTILFFLLLCGLSVNAQERKVRKSHFSDTLKTVKSHYFRSGRVLKRERVKRNDTIYIVEYSYDSLLVSGQVPLPPKVTVWYLKKSYPNTWRPVMVGAPMNPLQGRGTPIKPKDYIQLALNSNE